MNEQTKAAREALEAVTFTVAGLAGAFKVADEVAVEAVRRAALLKSQHRDALKELEAAARRLAELQAAEASS